MDQPWRIGIDDDLGRDWGDTDEAMLEEMSKSLSVAAIMSTAFRSCLSIGVEFTGCGSATGLDGSSNERSSERGSSPSFL
mmetsp:Transcript_12388/g.35371  ORF Transcript_12388/g.35371 Transcript_12388/m.35371 type:complete len:80 (-) Transcript_12388:3437-3676(-)